MDSCTTLRSTSPLPEGWSELEIVEDIFVADGVELHRVGVASTGPDGEEITGSAADAGFSPAPRGYFELLERAATLEALRERRASYALRTADGRPAGTCAGATLYPESDEPARWRYARSNGVAIHTDWNTAALRAFWELAERDRLLRCWYGDLAPVRLAFDGASTALAGAASYEWQAYAFPEVDPSSFSRDVSVAGVFGFPKRADVPLVLGYGARVDAAGALDAAVREATQLLAFLWGEPVTDQPPNPNSTPMFHLEQFQYPGHHGLLRGWLKGEHIQYRAKSSVPRASSAAVSFVDLTPAWLGGGHRVAKAFCPGAMPLTFGDVPFAAHLPANVRAHPIA
jgi:hypothetical protein